MRSSWIVAVLVLAVAALPALAQEDEERPAKYSFQGRVGALLSGDEPFENGAAFEIGMMMRLGGPLHLSIAGGTGNFDGGLEPVALTPEFEEFWSGVEEEFEITEKKQAAYRLNFFTTGLAAKFGAGSFEPYVVAGGGIYYVRFSQSFRYTEIAFPGNTALTNVTDSDYFFGGNFGGGINFKINALVGFAGQVTYHYIDCDGIDNQIMATFGLNVTLP